MDRIEALLNGTMISLDSRRSTKASRSRFIDRFSNARIDYEIEPSQSFRVVNGSRIRYFNPACIEQRCQQLLAEYRVGGSVLSAEELEEEGLPTPFSDLNRYHGDY